MASLLDLENRLKDLFNQGVSTVDNAVHNAGNFIAQDFQRSPVGQTINNFQRVGQAVQTPQFQQQVARPIQQKISNFSPGQAALSAIPGYQPLQRNILKPLRILQPPTIGQIGQNLSHQNQVMKAMTTPTNKQTPQQKQLEAEGVNNFVSGMLSPTKGEDLQKAAFYLRSKLDPEAANILKNFATAVETRGPQVNHGRLAQDAQAIITDAFGSDARNWTNQKMKNAIDLVLGKVGGMKNRAGIGLSMQNIRENPPQNLPIEPPKKISALQQFLNRSRNIIASQGPAGQELASRLQKSRDFAEKTAGLWVSKLPTVGKLTKDEFTNFVDVAEGNAQPLNPKIAQAAKEWDSIRQGVFMQAKNAGIDLGKIENYFPHMYDQSLFTDKNKYAEAINHLVNTGQATDINDAAQKLRYAQDVVRNRRQGNLEMERLVDLPGYEKTPKALFNYLESAANRIGQVYHLGQNDSEAMKLINQIAQQGGDASTIKNLYDIASGAKQYGELSSKISRGLRGYNSFTKLGTGALTNAGQSVNTATVVGGLRTFLNAPKAAFSQEAKDFALKAGVTLDGVLQDLREGSGFEGKLGTLGAPGFNTVEKFNRTLAAYAGRDYARSLAAKGDVATLQKMGIVLKGNKLTPDQEVQAARNIVERTQFKVDPQDLPGWTSSPLGKLVAQFRNFSYNQTAFLGREIIQPALQGNVAPLIRFLALGIPTGMAIQTGKNIIRNRKDEENPLKRVEQGFQQVGGLGLAGDITTGLFPMNGKYLDPARATTLAISTLGGPTAGNIATGYGALANAVQGKPENLGRFALQQVPLIGGTLQNTILPYKTSNGDVNQRFNFGIPQASASSKTQEADKNLRSDVKKTGKGQYDSQGNYVFRNPKGNTSTVELTAKTKGSGIDAYTNRNWGYAKAREIFGNKDLSDHEKTVLLGKLGVTPEQVQYDYKATKSNDIKSQYVLNKAKSMSHQDLLNEMVKGRKQSVSGTMFASNGVIDALNNTGYISDSEAKSLKSLKYDQSGNDISKSTQAKPKKITISETKPARVASIRKSSRKSLPKIKLSKGPVTAVKTKKNSNRNIKLALPTQGRSYQVNVGKIPSLTKAIKIV